MHPDDTAREESWRGLWYFEEGADVAQGGKIMNETKNHIQTLSHTGYTTMASYQRVT